MKSDIDSKEGLFLENTSIRDKTMKPENNFISKHTNFPLQKYGITTPNQGCRKWGEGGAIALLAF